MKVIKETASKILGMNGRMISGSKSGYSSRYPTNLAVFNANVCTQNEGKIWYGDIDLTLSREELSELARLLETEVYVLYEMDARFGNEASPKLDNAVVVFKQDGSWKIGKSWAEYVDSDKLTKKSIPFN
jgi:hypothetical protein